MGNPRISPRISLAGAVSAIALAGMLMLNPGTGGAATKPAPVKPAPVPAKPATPAVRPPVPGARPTVPGSRPVQPVQPGPKPPIQGTRPVPGTVPNPTHPMGTEPRPVHTPPVRDAKGNFHTQSGIEGKMDPKTGRVPVMSKTDPITGSRTIVHNTPTGQHIVESRTKDPYSPGHEVRTVGNGHIGFRERELSRRPGYMQRTYYDHGHTYVRVYHERVYGVYGAYPVYVPVYYYHPAFYAYFGAPWTVQVSFGWGGYVGYAYYGAYFAPAPYYVSPDAWMADYIIANNLQANYTAQQDAAADAAQAGSVQAEAQTAQPAPIPQTVRDAYVQQVQTQVEVAQAEANGKQAADDVPGALSPKFRVFQSYTDVEATTSAGQTCALTGGDFVRREEDTPDASKTVAVTVVTVAKPTASHCEANTQVRLAVDTLQDWYNSFAAAQQAGFDAMAANQGKNGFPAMSDTAKVSNPAGQGTPEDPNALAAEIQTQQTTASSMQAEVGGGGKQ